MHSPAGLGAFDLVLCRNVMIYFDQPTRERVCQSMNRVLQAGGWLALGAAESLSCDSGLKGVKFGRALLYRKPGAAH
jgi:chemotaxis protein methyltransferase CheR